LFPEEAECVTEDAPDDLVPEYPELEVDDLVPENPVEPLVPEEDVDDLVPENPFEDLVPEELAEESVVVEADPVRRVEAGDSPFPVCTKSLPSITKPIPLPAL
jgi:hypothetical protein